MLIRRAIVLGCALVALGAACSGSDGSSEGSTTTAAPTATSRAPTTTKPRSTPPPPNALSNLILRDLTGGFKLQPDDVADTGPTDLAKAALDDVSCNLGCDARRELTGSGFVHGYQRQWTNVDAEGSAINQDFVFLYEFKTPTGAQRYAEHWRETLLSTNQGAAVEAFTPLAPPGAVGLRVADRLGSTGVVIFAKGPYAVKATVNGGPNIDQAGPATDLGFRQHERLP